MSQRRRIGIVGMGYVGLTLAAAMAEAGFEVHGVDTQQTVLDGLARGRPHIFEPGVEEIFRRRIGRDIHVGPDIPDGLEAVVLCVSTPVDPATHEPRLENLAAAARHVARACGPESLVVVRSTVPVGATREVVLPPLVAAWGTVRLVMAPERTIQGQALRELRELPQVVGGLDDASLERGIRLFAGLSREVVPVSGLEAAELVKLVNNCHTDVLYSFGNEVAMLTGRLGLDPLEVLRAANLHYPRPDIAQPGYVGGGCLSKDPYIMMSAAARVGYDAPLVGAARALNERMPTAVAGQVIDELRRERGTTLAVLGWAYKGRPPTDDMRGAPIAAMMPLFTAAGLRVLGHDPLVPAGVIEAYGGRPVGLEEAFREADGLLVLTDHPEYRALDVRPLLVSSRLRFVFDSWRILDRDAVAAAGLTYHGLGYEFTGSPATPEVGVA